MSAFNNNNSNLNNTSAGQAGRVSNMNSTATHPSDQLNQNHGIAATGLNEPHTHINAPTQGKNGLNYSGAPIADTRMVDQQENYGHTAGHDLNSNTNRTGGTGIPPVNTAEHVRRNHAEEAIAGNHHHDEKALHGSHGATGNHHNPISTDTRHSGVADRHNPLSTGGATTGNHNPLSTGGGATTGNHNPLSTGNQRQNDHFTTGAGVVNQNRNDPTAVGTTGANHHTGAPLGTGLPNRDQKHVGDQHFNDKRGNLDHSKHDNLGNNNALNQDHTKVSAGDKIKGNLEKVTGKITGNEAKVVEGENIAQGRNI
ncbi:hypothetical protein INT48_005399 [Thamnidium elegans]|uniref:Uncharacterized protein n=1 Tax=Thamnidium elegans TaxID=101142 RepID=A0A8H7SKQ5_9FUNG|nr:hypothetical protein INT48_005399 [Thamnidium elegans]